MQVIFPTGGTIPPTLNLSFGGRSGSPGMHSAAVWELQNRVEIEHDVAYFLLFDPQSSASGD